MAGETTSQQVSMDQALYDQLYQRFFQGQGIGIERYVSGDLKASRYEDIQDSFAGYQGLIEGLFPDQDNSTRRKILAVCTFFERIGCESGIVFAATNRPSGEDSDVSFRRRVAEGSNSPYVR